jgi:hypothetical protein
MNLNNPYDDIDFCLELLYNSVYKENESDLYNLEPISRRDIRISNLRKDTDYDYTQILNSKFKLHGYYNGRLHYTRFGIYPSTMSVGFCNKKINLNDLLRPELYHMAMLYMSSEYVFDEHFNHILLPIMCFDIKKENLLKYLPNIEKDFGDNFQKDNDNMYIIITEHYHKMMTLREFLDLNQDTITIKQIKSILFQIYFTLLKLSERFNKFRHNKLNLDAILILPKEQKDDIYKYGELIFKINSNDIDIKITDFDYSYHNSEYIKNDNNFIKFEGGNIENPYYDVHYITNLLYLYIESNKKNENIYKISKSLKDFFTEILPDKYKIITTENYKGLNQELFNISSDEIITPLKIIKKNIFFKDFIMNNIKEPIESMNIKDSNIKYIESSFLNKFQNKKSNQYYSNMIKGSRKISGLELSESTNNNMSEAVAGGAKKNMGFSATSTMRSYKKHNDTSSTSFTVTDNSVATMVNPDLTSVSEKKLSKKNKKHSKSRKNRLDRGKSDKKSSSSSDSSKSSKSSKSSSSSSTETEDMGRTQKNMNQDLEYINYLNVNDRKKLQKLPDGYVDAAPEHMLQNMPNLNQPGISDMGMQFNQMNMNPMMPPGMPPGMPSGPMGPSSVNVQQALAQMQPPPMPADMQQIAMQGQMGQMNQQLNVPMMNNPMSQFMGMQPQPMQMGGSKDKKKMQKYTLSLDKNFFF